MNIGIIGLGLIGGSLGLDLFTHRQQTQTPIPPCHSPASPPLSYRILGISRKQQTCDVAVERGVVDAASVDLSLMGEADIIFICTPIAAIAPTIAELIPYLQPHTILTDVGSVKKPIVETCSQLWPNFVGGHPMAGNTETGIDAAQHHLFINKPYVITPTDHTPPESIKIVESIVNLLQAKIYHCQPEEHDRAVAWISHLPVIISGSLIAALRLEDNPDVDLLAHYFASSGFRDTSRVGGGNPELGLMMAKYNREALLRSLKSYKQTLDQITDYIEKEDWQTLDKQLHQNHSDRLKFDF
ncbi:prephenate/arogenate dehydrogenase [Planktothrix paucivesiculata]|uniref:6-phosphogluconate dehydrogenase, NAD-binding n=1 Tax=Planktothrix paucivesiculata PCC 9631 TaxID=671071 RepID=A0A7Z9BTJ6_9CYAN|nr:prephenate/arogenate dehydrogenase [Planktothrix paucivesiculata]VXD20402.1 6-phosphogluconate dehydrogenase, NAD-binding [Planktothrix paucivesiculata PCC 9631]